MKSHQLSRRMVLTELGKSTLAVSILGTAVLSCSSDNEAALPPPTASPLPSAPPAEPTSPPAPDPTDSPAETTTVDPESASEALRWERVSFDFVSAYVLARGNEVAIVDTGTSGSADRFSDAFAALSVGWGDVDHVIVTHLHGDHVGGLGDVLTAAPDAIAYAGEADVAGIRASRDLSPVNDGDEVFGLQIIGTPGHTAGHISVLDAGIGLLVAGDALNESAGEILGPNPGFSADMGLANQSVARIARERFGTAVFGHGNPVIGMADELVASLAATL